MDMLQYYRVYVLWISLHALTLVKKTATKPSGTNILVGRANSDVATDRYAEYEYSDNWASRSSGFVDYADVDVFTPRFCPEICTCVVETILYCSRQEIKFIGSQKGSRNSNGRTLDGAIPNNTKSIHLGYNNITFLPARLFEELMENSPCKISDLYLQNNQISRVHPDAFIDLVNLKNLDLSNNRITHIVQSCEGSSNVGSSNASCVQGKTEAIFLRSLPAGLISLNLNGNLIRGIPNYSFESLSGLKVLRLSFNQITWISRKAFDGLVELRVLQIRANSLGTKTALKLGDILQHFVTQTRPVKLNYSSELENVEFYPSQVNLAHLGRRNKRYARINVTRQKLGKEQYEIISVNSLEDLDLGETNISRFPVVIPPSVRRLYLDLNRISTIPKGVFKTAKGIELLQLGGNRIFQISDAAFSSLQSLRVLDLSRNNLTKLTQNTFNGLLRLVSLRLYGNRELAELPRKVFWSLPMLRVLYLHNCNLTNLPPGPWMFRVLALWLYGNPIECNCRNLLSLMVRIYRPIHPSFNLRLDPYRSVLWDDSDTWKYQTPVKTQCATPQHFRGHRLESIRVSDILCTYQDHYETEISRQISSYQFLSSDYQQDQSMAGQKREIKNIGQLMNDYGSLEDDENGEGDIYDDKTIIPSLGQQFPVSNATEQVVIPRLVDVDVVVDSSPRKEKERLGGSVLEGVDSISTKNTESDFHQNFGVLSNHFNLLGNGGKKKAPHVKTHPSPEETPREWLISIPGNVAIEQKDGQERQMTADTSSVDFSSKQPEIEAGMTETATKTKKDSSYDLVIEIGEKLEQTHERSNITDQDAIGTQSYNYNRFDTENMTWKEHSQGFADYAMYDDGDMELDMDSILHFSDEKRATLNESDNQRLRIETEGVNAWKTYQEYYGDVESSGDFQATMQFVAHMKDLRESGATAEDVIGNLTNMYNISDDYLEYEESYSLEDEDIGVLLLDGDW